MEDFFLEYNCVKAEGNKMDASLSCSFMDNPSMICFAACEALLFAMNIEHTEGDKPKDKIFQECLNHLAYFLKEDTMVDIQKKEVDSKDDILTNVCEN